MITRIVIAGGPRTGKTSLAERLFSTAGWCDCGCTEALHTDNLAHLGWSEASAAAALWLDAPGPWIVEGVAAVRALRKWLAAHPVCVAHRQDVPCRFCVAEVAEACGGRRGNGGPSEMSKPCDIVYWLTDPVVERTPGQVTMAKGCATVFEEIRGELDRRGVEIRCGLP